MTLIVSILYFIRKINAVYSKNADNMIPSGSSIEKCTVVSPIKLMLEGWCSVGHQATEYFIIMRFIKPNIEIKVQILDDFSGLLINL